MSIRWLRMLFWFLIGVIGYLMTNVSSTQEAAIIAFIIFILIFGRSIIINGIANGLTILILFMGLFHLGLVVPIFVFDTPPPVINFPWLYEADLSNSIAIIIIGLAMTQAGIEFVARKPKSDVKDYNNNEKFKMMFKLFFFTQLFFVILYMFFGMKYNILFSPRTVYLELQGTIQGELYGISRELMVISGFITIAFAKKKWALVSSLITVTMLFPMFIEGQRGLFLVTVAALIVVLLRKGVKIPKIFMGIMFIVLFFSITIIRQMRGGHESFTTVPFLDPLYEMGMQLRTVYYTLQAHATGMTNFWYGESYLNALAKVVPNVFQIRQIIGGITADSPAHWLTDTFRPGGAGLGYSIFAEPYLNFGLLGSIFIPFLIGYFVKLIERNSNGSPYYIAFYGIFIQSILWAVRNDFYGVFRPFFWGMLLMVVYWFITESVWRKKSFISSKKLYF